MSTRMKAVGSGKMPTQFADMVRLMPPRIIHDEAEYDNVIEFMDGLLARPKLSAGQLDFVDTWSVLIDEYEREHHGVDTSGLSGLDSLKYLMDEHQMNASDLGRLLGNVSIGSKLMRGERQLSKEHIRKLCEHFHISADVFLG